MWDAAVAGRGVYRENWGLGLTCQEVGAMSAQASPSILSDSTSCVFAVYIFSRNWKERKFGGHATSLAPTSSTHATWCEGAGGALRPSASGGWDGTPAHCQHRCWA